MMRSGYVVHILGGLVETQAETAAAGVPLTSSAFVGQVLQPNGRSSACPSEPTLVIQRQYERLLMSTTEDNKQLMRRFTDEFWNSGNTAFADEVIAADLIHDQVPADWPTGREGFKRLVQTWRTAFPDLHEHLEFVLAEGDRALGRFRLTGTHQGPFYGIEPTGKSVDIHGVDVARILDGQIVEYFYHEDTFGLFRQLGSFPADMSEVAGTIQDDSVTRRSGPD